MSGQISFLYHNLINLLIGFPGSRPGGLLLSVVLAATAISLGFVIAILLATAAESRLRPVRWLGRLYVEIFRGLPLILLVLFVHQLSGSVLGLNLNWRPRTSALVALVLYSSAYQTEILRAGVQAVPPQLVESARVLGSTRWQAHLLVRLRYGLRVMLPAFTGQAVSLFKDTSVVVIIGVSELMTVARVALGSDVTNAPYWVGMYLLVGFIYFCIAFALSSMAHQWEKRIPAGALVQSLSNY